MKTQMTTVSLQEFYDMLEKHDWYHMFSDSNSVDQKGKAERSKLNQIAQQSLEHEKLLEEYHQSVWNRTPVPTRP